MIFWGSEPDRRPSRACAASISSIERTLVARRARSSAPSTSIIVWVESWTATVEVEEEEDEEIDEVTAVEERGGSAVEGIVKAASMVGVVASLVVERGTAGVDADAISCACGCECDFGHPRWSVTSGPVLVGPSGRSSIQNKNNKTNAVLSEQPQNSDSVVLRKGGDSLMAVGVARIFFHVKIGGKSYPGWG